MNWKQLGRSETGVSTKMSSTTVIAMRRQSVPSTTMPRRTRRPAMFDNFFSHLKSQKNANEV
jgi:hypothetical protein